MTDDKNTNEIPNGAGDGDTSDNAEDTSSGGKPEGLTPDTESPDGTPVENPSGG